MPDENRYAYLLRQAKAVVVDDHFVYTSGLHGNAYVNKDAIYPHTVYVEMICEEFAIRFFNSDVQVVVGPAMGGIILSNRTAHQLHDFSGIKVPGIYAEKSADGAEFVIKRGYGAFIPGKRVLVVEDILTTGGSVRKVVNAVRALGGNVVGVGAICNRGGVSASDVGDVPKLECLIDVKLDSWNPQDCPMCKAGIPVNTELGKGREYLASLAKTE
jgi:orotate phosphoribosyltransferase